ncbi:MAG: hypothetical protein NTZ44_04215 [Candidatus Nomurabacteria bacterium]|nr:hypothetical protein [Candidatus Nomurabacteria bacterium]
MEHQSESKICQNCKGTFVIVPEDFSFYEKIKVPPPTFCPECRMIRRLLNRNERVLFKTNCKLCEKQIFTIYHPDNNFIIYCSLCYTSDKWDPLSFGQDYNFSIPFFKQLSELQKKVPRKALHETMSENCEYANYVLNSKDVYLSFTSVDSNWIYYCRSADRSKECMDCYNIIDCESLYECIQVSKSYGSSNLIDSHSCVSSHFLFDCTNCTDCCMSSNLKNSKYIFRNQQLTHEQYYKVIKDLNLQSRKSRDSLKEEFAKVVNNSIHRFAHIIGSVDVVGDNILRSKKLRNSFHATESEDSKYIMRTVGLKTSYDVFGSLQGELLYEVHGGGRGSHNSHFIAIGNATVDSEYTDFCTNVQNLFASISIDKKSYCILNKQYTKEEYFKLKEKIIQHMKEMPYIDKDRLVYSYGEYFPSICIPFSYNESAAQEFFPLTKEEIISKGYLYREAVINDYDATIFSEDISDEINDQKICNETLECKHKKICTTHRCTGVFKITENEYLFYKKFNLPIPNLCPNCRHYERLIFVRPPILWSRQCMCDKENHGHQGKCEIEFETTYAPDRPEKVYCEKCYQQEIY